MIKINTDKMNWRNKAKLWVLLSLALMANFFVMSGRKVSKYLDWSE